MTFETKVKPVTTRGIAKHWTLLTSCRWSDEDDLTQK